MPALTIHTWFSWAQKPTDRKPILQPYTCIRGADWFLQELGNQAGSYEIIQQDTANGDTVLRQRTVRRGADWLGTNYLESDTGMAEVFKQTAAGVWFRCEGIEYVHLASDAGWSEVERFLAS